jgi:hypothetical protein
METESCSKVAQKYVCLFCDYTTCKKSSYDKHLSTQKHSIKSSYNTYNQKVAKSCSQHICEKCNKIYNSRVGLWHHKKKCVLPTQPQEEYSPSQDDMQLPTIPTTLIFELIKQNQEFKQMLFDQSKLVAEQNKQLYEKHEENIDLQKQLLEVAKNQGSNNNNTLSNNNNNNKTFNLQFFLNETCKDAMNMKDFIQSLEMSLPELEKMGEVGFAEGMSRLFVDRLNKLDITKRPIHCSDVKREIIHIKDDNKWERDNANLDRLRKIIKQLTIKNILRVEDWKKANQGCTEYNSRKNEQYLRINMEAIGPVDDVEVKRDFGKIIRRVAENTAIDKKYLLA